MIKVVIIGSDSIHSKRYIAGVAASGKFELSLVSNRKMAEFPDIPQLTVNFALRNLKAVGIIYEQLSAIRPDVVHIHQANSYAWHAIRAVNKLARRPKVILTAWGSDVLVLPDKNKLLAKMVRYNLQNADIITADSLYMSARIAELLAGIDKPIYTVNYGIRYLPPLQDSLPKEKMILSNRLHKPLYRVDKIIRAFAGLVSSRQIDDEYKLVIAGDGEATPHLHELTSRLEIADRVRFTGLLDYDTLVTYYQRAAIFVSVPASDGTASSLLEAMAYGCIPVLSNLPANLEWVLDQVNGFIVSNVDQLHRQIIQAIRLSQHPEEYLKLKQFNYGLIKAKANFASNLEVFSGLYQ